MFKKLTMVLLGLVLTINVTSCEKLCEEKTSCIDKSLIDKSVAIMTIWDPVCGCDGNTYSNEAAAKYHGGVTSYTFGPCEEEVTDCVDSALIQPNAIITTDWNPVCGCNGVPYSNPASAKVHGGVTTYTLGECETTGILQN